MGEVVHQNIAHMYDLLYDDNFFYIVSEVSNFGDLSKFLLAQYKSDKANLDEISVQYIAKQLFSALDYLHTKNIAHRDVKLENIMITRKSGERIRIGLIDFGCASPFDPKAPFRQQLGSRHYIAPEIVTGSPYGLKADIWSATIAVYVLLTMTLPAFGKDLGVYKEQIENNELDFLLETAFDHRRFRHLSKEGIEWLKQGLRIDPTKRASAKLMLNHPWLHRTTLHPPQPIQCQSLSQTAILVRAGRKAGDHDVEKLMTLLFQLD